MTISLSCFRDKIYDKIRYLDGNRFNNFTFFEMPILGLASANDPLFVTLKRNDIIGEFHTLPQDWMPDAVTVISYFLPFTKTIRNSNYVGKHASPEWQHGRFRGETFNNNVRKMICDELIIAGGKAVAPVLNDKKFFFDKVKLRSNWSERHIAYVCGLGSFGLNRGLITKKGMAGRFGSVISNVDIKCESKHAKEVFLDYCNTCGKCISRCPSGAISLDGKNKETCANYLFYSLQAENVRTQFAYPSAACGKCQTRVPCETVKPRNI